MSDSNRPDAPLPQEFYSPEGGPPPPVRGPAHWTTFAFVAVVLAGAWILSATGVIQPALDGEGEILHFGLWSVLPALVAIVLAFWLKEVITALVIGILLGGIISGNINIVSAYLLPSIATSNYALILLVYLWALGGLIGIWTRTAGATHFANWAAQKMVVGRRSAKVFTWFMGLVFHQGGTISTVLTGATVRSIGDKNRVSHEELSYVVDSTASPAAALIPFNVWPFYIGAIVAGTIPMFQTGEAAGDTQAAVAFFFKAIPFNFYAIFAVLLTLLLAWEKLPWVGGRMKAAMKRVKDTGQLDRPGSSPMASNELTELQVPAGYRPGLIDFFGPIGTLLGVAILPYLWFFVIQGDRDFSMLIAEAFVLAVVAGFAIALVKGMPLRTAMEGFIGGCKGVTIGALILALALTLKSVGTSVGTAAFITGAFAEGLPPALLPALFMLLCMVIAFSTGTSFGTYAIVFPIALPLAWTVAPDPFFITVCFASVVGGSLFGDQCSPISDTTILSSLGTGCDLMDHVYTQLPLALAAAIAAMVIYTAMVFMFV